jgi:hypothetical protein
VVAKASEKRGGEIPLLPMLWLEWLEGALGVVFEKWSGEGDPSSISFLFMIKGFCSGESIVDE